MYGVTYIRVIHVHGLSISNCIPYMEGLGMDCSQSLYAIRDAHCELSRGFGVF